MTNKLDESQIIKRVLDISYKHKLSHLGSCLSAVKPLINIFEKIFFVNDKFVLSCGHAGLTYYVILEALGYGDAEVMLETAGIHPDRNINDIYPVIIDCSTGSLGQGLPIALGMAIADPNVDVYCLISDGECAEGSIWEALRIKDDLKVKNLKVYVNINGYGAYSVIDGQKLEMRLRMFDPDIMVYYTNVEQYPFLKGVDAHYHVMSEEDYKLI